jgi:hypothetical protein
VMNQSTILGRSSSKSKKKCAHTVFDFECPKHSRRKLGGIAQLGEHLPCKQGVMSSNLIISTTFAGRPVSHLENRITMKKTLQ